MGDTNISWTDMVWNPTTGCTKVSNGCRSCYAATLDKRFHRDGPYVPWTVAAQRKAGVSAIHLHPERLDAPLHWKKPRRIFLNSMSDLFHEDVPDEFIAAVFGVMATTPQHTFQILTKRPERMLEVLRELSLDEAFLRAALKLSKEGFQAWRRTGITHRGPYPWPLPNVWLGVSVENQRYADERLPILAQVPAAVRFVSLEPLLGPIGAKLIPYLDTYDGVHTLFEAPGMQQRFVGQPLQWVIVGGESGPNYRPMQVEWVEAIAHFCEMFHVPLWVKQDSGPRPGQQGRIPDALWQRKETP